MTWRIGLAVLGWIVVAVMVVISVIFTITEIIVVFG